MKKLALLSGFAVALCGAALTHAQDAAPTPGVAPTPAEAVAPAPAEAPAVSPPATAVAAPAPVAPAPADTAIAAAAPAAPLYGAATEASMGELSQAELEALGFGGGEEAPRVDTDLKIFGFTDFSMRAFIPRDGPWSGQLAPHRSFAIGNFNLYVSKNLSEKWRTMGEVRFMYLPNGGQVATGAPQITTLVGDYNDNNRVVKWGGILIQRVYLEYSAFKYMSVRAGQFLTPYGIWNVDHGSPTYIPVARPFVIGSNWFPERQTGLEVFGRYDLSLQNSVGYHVTLSNGQGISAEYADWDDNKAVGGRLYWENHALGDLRLGASGYYGTLTDATQAISVSGGKVIFGQKNSVQYHNLSLAADAQWKYKGLHLQAEVLAQQVDFTRNGRTLLTGSTTGEPSYAVDHVSWGTYFLAGYRLPWFGIMPYEIVQWIDQGSPTGTLRFSMINLETGLNIRVIDSVVLKLAYGWAHFPGGVATVTDDNIHMIVSQAAWAF